MLLPRISALLSLLAAAQAFKDASPFLMVSSEALDQLMHPVEVQTAEKVDAALAKYYSDKSLCQTGRQVLVSQPGLTVSDMQSMPKLASIATSQKLPWKLTIPNVIGELDVETVRYHMEAACGQALEIKDNTWSWASTKAQNARMAIVRGEALPNKAGTREKALADLDERLSTILGEFPQSQPLTFILVSKPDLDENTRYEMDSPYQEVLHQDLKRDTYARAANSSRGNSTRDNFQDGLPLFEKYAYFSPALFMGLSVSILLLVILYIGISAIAGLEVSYMAFSKEMAPQNQKKQQ